MESHLQSVSESAKCTVNMTTNDAFHVVEVPPYAALQRQIHDMLRAQHPEWVQPNGDSPTCDFYDSRFAELLRILARAPVTKNAQRFANGAMQFWSPPESLIKSKRKPNAPQVAI
jgi:hypothetical protein